MVTIFGRQPSPNIIDRRASRTGGAFAAVAGLLGLLGSTAASIGFTGIDATLCLIGVGDCQFSVSRIERPKVNELPEPSDECAPSADGTSPEAVSGASTNPRADGCPGGREVSEFDKDRLERLVAVILGDAERIWTADFEARGEIFRPATLVLFDQAQDTACGRLPAGAAPTYCKRDERIYIDFVFFDEIVTKYGAEGDAIPAFIIAHEMSHHVQNLRGDFDRYLAALAALKTLGEDESDPEDTPNQLLTRFELQADCLAGVAAARAQKEYDLLDAEDVEDAIRGATRLGDDNIQRVESGFVNEAAFTHGSGAQRLKWLERGYFSGDVDVCDTWTIPYADL